MEHPDKKGPGLLLGAVWVVALVMLLGLAGFFIATLLSGTRLNF